MALGATTYKTPNIINQIGENLTDMEGCGVYLSVANTVWVARASTEVPYGIIVTGTDSLTPGSYPSAIADASLELVDQLGCAVQVRAANTVTAGDLIVIDNNDADGTFKSTNDQTPAEGDWIWGIALTDAAYGDQFLMRFQPYVVQYVEP